VTESSVPATYSPIVDNAPEGDLWINRCLLGEQDAYITVYNQYAGIIYRLCLSLLQQKEDAEEVLQDSFEYAFRRLDLFDPQKASFKTWLYQIAISRCRNKRRRQWLKTLPLTGFFAEQTADDNTPTPTEALDLTERQRVIWEAIGELSPKLKEVAILRYYESLKYTEIGNILSISPKTAESRMRLAHSSLRRLLKEEFD